MNPPRIFIDALNVAYWCGHPPSLRLPLALMSPLLADGHSVQMVFDASARHQFNSEADLYARLMQYPQHFIEVPSGRTADGVLLRYATSSGACIISRDRYRDYRRRYRKLIDDPARLIPGIIENDRLLIPALTLDLQLPASAQDAWQQLEALLLGPAGASPP